MAANATEQQGADQTAPKTNGDKILASAVQALTDGIEAPGFTLIPVRKVKGNHTVEDTGEVVERGGIKYAVCVVRGV